MYTFTLWLKLNPKYLKLHHIFGGLAFILIMLHPLFLVDYLDYVLTFQDWGVNLGIIAMLLLMFMLLITFIVVLPYRKWKSIHRFLILPLLLGAIHGNLTNPDYRLIVIPIAIIGLIIWLYELIRSKQMA